MSACLSGDVRRMQLAFLAQLPREMSQTDRTHPRYFLLRIRVSIRRRIFYMLKNRKITDRRRRMVQRHRTSERSRQVARPA